MFNFLCTECGEHCEVTLDDETASSECCNAGMVDDAGREVDYHDYMEMLKPDPYEDEKQRNL